MNIYILVYGSLRKGEYNYSSEELEYIDTVELDGFNLYSLGAYPGIKVSQNGKIICDLMKVKNNSASNSIDYMELGAGYSIRPIMVQVNNKSYACKIYVYEYEVKDNNLVESGDWSKFLKGKKDKICVD